MLVFLIITVSLSSIALAYLYFMRLTGFKFKQKIMVFALWLIIFSATMFICANLSYIGIIFNPQAAEIDFMQTIQIDYLQLFIFDLVIMAVIVGVYFLITRKFNLAPLWVLVALVGLVIYLYYPGIPSADGIDTSYQQFLTKHYTDFQPPLFTLWWQIFQVKSAAFIMNSIMYYSGLIYISYFLRKSGRQWQNDLLVLFCLNPLLFTQLAIVWKDISFTGCLIDCVAIYLAITKSHHKTFIIGAWVVYFALLFLAMGLRFNGVISVFPFILWGVAQILSGCLSQNRWLRYFGLTGISLVIMAVFGVSNYLITYKVFAAEPTNLKGGVMLANLAAMECISQHEYRIDTKYFSPAQEDSHEIFCDRVINYYNNDAYVANWSGTGVVLNWHHTEENFVQLKAQWISALLHYPLTYFIYRAQYFSNVLFFNYWYPTGTLTPSPDFLSAVAMHQHLDMKIILPVFLIAGTSALLFLCIYFQIYGLSWVILSSNLLQLINLFILIPNHSARYFFWDYLAVVLALILLKLPQKPNRESVPKLDHKALK
jgi:hypothetical protein